ncbi:hypothetical protein BGP76_00185 [Reichenbachiella sp. MSK19-1]|nr:hypothetical protein BGP76_00185 [Reichenbachiella sp. MSK19-1]
MTNALGNPSLLETLSEYGYTAEVLAVGKALYEDAKVKQEKQKKEYGEQYQATDALDAAKYAANKAYIKQVKLARIVLKDNRGALEALDISGRRKQTYSGWLSQASVFYTNALADATVLAELSKLSITEAVLTASKEAVADVADKLAVQLKEKGDAQAATEVRDRAVEELEDWMGDFIGIARVALQDEPQMLEMLGIVEPS